MAHSITTKRSARSFPALRDLSPKIGAFLATAHTMPGKRDAVDISGVAVTRVPGRRAPRPAMHAKGDTTGHTQRDVCLAMQVRRRNTGAQR